MPHAEQKARLLANHPPWAPASKPKRYRNPHVDDNSRMKQEGKKKADTVYKRALEEVL